MCQKNIERLKAFVFLSVYISILIIIFGLTYQKMNEIPSQIEANETATQIKRSQELILSKESMVTANNTDRCYFKVTLSIEDLSDDQWREVYRLFANTVNNTIRSSLVGAMVKITEKENKDVHEIENIGTRAIMSDLIQDLIIEEIMPILSKEPYNWNIIQITQFILIASDIYGEILNDASKKVS